MKNNVHLAFLSFVFFMWLNGNSILSQTTRNVPSQYSTIQTAIDAATNGDTVLVDNGIYYEEVNFKGKLIKLISKSGTTNTIIEALDGRFFRGVRFESGENSNAVISGFSIRKFSQYGIYCENSSPTIQNNTIHNNTEAGVYCYGASPKILSNVIKNGPIHPQQQNGIVALLGSNPQIFRNLILNNTEEGVQLAGASAQIVNNTIVNNLASGIEINGAIPTITNNVIVGNGNNTGIKNVSSPPGNPAFNYNDVWNNATNYFNCSPGAASISKPPLFVNQNTSDFHLQSTSPCIDTGDPTSPLDPDGTRADMGAFYFHQGTTEIFTDISAQLSGVAWSSAAWGDYDNDGDL
ncbi:right-handed parallel beta-helix repeat-containing protein, partial [bacterium]|nr:right-handed parallel beta-helix repeat-containing protein [bacterium]